MQPIFHTVGEPESQVKRTITVRTYDMAIGMAIGERGDISEEMLRPIFGGIHVETVDSPDKALKAVVCGVLAMKEFDTSKEARGCCDAVFMVGQSLRQTNGTHRALKEAVDVSMPYRGI